MNNVIYFCPIVINNYYHNLLFRFVQLLIKKYMFGVQVHRK